MKYKVLFWCGFAVAVLAGINLAVAQEITPPEEPVALGAWLYGGYCTRCHGMYTTSVAGESLEADEMRDIISGDARGCQVKWGLLHGGPLSRRELDALVEFIISWQGSEGPPELPPLPAFPTATPAPSATPDALKPTRLPEPTPFSESDPRILLIINGNPVAQGARLYTRRCYRCHLSYEYGRMGIGMDEEKIKRTINEGKAGTSMPAFGLRSGGDLKVSEVNALIAYITAWEKLGSEPALPGEIFNPPTPAPGELGMIPLQTVAPLVGRVEKGLVLFSEFCQDCHGLGGYGATGPSLHKYWNSVRADLTIRSTLMNGLPGTPMLDWRDNFDEDEINSLVALLLEWSAENQPVEEILQEKEKNRWLPGLLAVIVIGFILAIRRRTD